MSRSVIIMGGVLQIVRDFEKASKAISPSENDCISLRFQLTVEQATVRSCRCWGNCRMYSGAPQLATLRVVDAGPAALFYSGSVGILYSNSPILASARDILNRFNPLTLKFGMEHKLLVFIRNLAEPSSPVPIRGIT